MQDSQQKYQIIARKFRPQLFEEVVGQDAIVTTLKNALRLQRLSHAYLFCGSRGTGKTTLARLFAKALNCRQLTENQEPCNACPSCLEIASGKALDVLEIDGASNRGIDDIRQINETIGYAPALGRFKIYIIDEVHMLTKEAFNALLKTLEEPPATVKFFFATTEPHKVLPTIISRCQRFDLRRIAHGAMGEKLRVIVNALNVEVEKEALDLIVSMAEGSLRDAQSLLDQVLCYGSSPITVDSVASSLGILSKSTFFALDKAIHSHNLAYAFELADLLFSQGKDFGSFIEGLMEHHRTLLFLKLHPGQKASSAYLEMAALYQEEHCLYILDYLMASLQQALKSSFKRVTLEMLLLHLIRSKYQLSPPALIKKLLTMESKFSSPQQEELPKEKIYTPPPEPPAKPTPLPQESPKEVEVSKEAPRQEQLKYDTILRFAAVELEGTLKKDYT